MGASVMGPHLARANADGLGDLAGRPIVDCITALRALETRSNDQSNRSVGREAKSDGLRVGRAFPQTSSSSSAPTVGLASSKEKLSATNNLLDLRWRSARLQWASAPPLSSDLEPADKITRLAWRGPLEELAWSRDSSSCYSYTRPHARPSQRGSTRVLNK